MMLAMVGVYGAEGLGMGFRSINWFGARGGYGLFGRSGLTIRGYKIEAMYRNSPVTLSGSTFETGTIFSIKQVGIKGGNLLRWDYGLLHGTERVGLHSTFRFNIGGVTYGSTAQYPVFAPYRFWMYRQL